MQKKQSSPLPEVAMTREQLKAKYPHCSESFLRRNATAECVETFPTVSRAPSRTEHSAVAPSGMTTDELKLNKTERRWLEILRRIKALNPATCVFVGIQSHTLKLAHDTRYTPDFLTVTDTGLHTYWEVKGKHIWEDSLIKIRTAARMFPFYQFILVQWKDNQWTQKVIKP